MSNNKRFQEPPIYAYNLPQDLLESLEPVEKEETEAEEAYFQDITSDGQSVNALALERLHIQQERLAEEGGASSLTCNTCGAISFESRDDQRSHFNTDWHRYNIKRKVVLDVKPVTFEEFEGLLAGSIFANQKKSIERGISN
jgi:hypothetical protein